MPLFVATVALGAGFLLLWIGTAIFCYFRVGLLDPIIWKHVDKLKSREYEEIETNVADRVTRFMNVNKENVKKLELASFLYDTIQISFFVFSAPSEFWNPTNEWAEFIIYFIRLFCLDLPVSLMTPLFVIYLILLGIYFLLSIFYSYTKNSASVVVQQMNANVSVVASMDRNAPELMNFFFSSMFFTFCRFSFKLVACSADSPLHTGKFLVDDFYGDFTCWNSTNSIPLLLFCASLLIVLLIVAVLWANRRGCYTSAFPCTERFACWLILVKFLLCGMMVFFYTQPLIPIVATLIAWFVTAIMVFRQLPYLTYGGQSMHYNTYLFGSLVLGVYFSICALLLNTFAQSQLGLLYFVGAIFVLVFAIVIITHIMQKYKSTVFSLKNKEFGLQLLKCIVYNDMLRPCTDYLVANWCEDPILAKKVLDLMENSLTEEENTTLLAFSPSKTSFLEWWWKWEFNHPKPGSIHRIVLHRIHLNTTVPKLVDLCCYHIVKTNESGWRDLDGISYDMKNYIEELIAPVSDFDPSDVIIKGGSRLRDVTVGVQEADMDDAN